MKPESAGFEQTLVSGSARYSQAIKIKARALSLFAAVISIWCIKRGIVIASGRTLIDQSGSTLHLNHERHVPHIDLNNFSPLFAFAFSPFHRIKTSWRRWRCNAKTAKNSRPLNRRTCIARFMKSMPIKFNWFSLCLCLCQHEIRARSHLNSDSQTWKF